MGDKKKPLKRGPVRDNLEAFGVAILAAVLLKYFAIEAYQIPTSSMQPTLMGSVEAGVYDRILVDKFHYTVFEPERWDVPVFRYPLQKNQNYVKRIVGVGGDRLHIAGGNLYRVATAENGDAYAILRKPDRIQAGLWKEVYPLRRTVRGDRTALGSSFSAQPRNKWSESEDELTVDLASGRSGVLAFRDEEDGGFVNRIWDGYPVAVSRDMREAHRSRNTDLELVPDARIHTTLRPERSLEEVRWEIEVVRPGRQPLAFAATVAGGQATLQVLEGRNRRPVQQSEPVAFEIAPGADTEVVFAHRDDLLRLWRDGELVAEFDVSDHPVRDGLELLGGARPDHRVTPMLVLKGGGKTAVTGLRIDRDLHYTLLGLPPDHVIEVPENHFFMMGDNTLQSVDSRGWTAVVLGVLPDGSVVPPDTEGARIVRGNLRPVPPSEPPDRDETPIAFPDRQTLVMIDEFGEVHRFRASIDPSWGQRSEGSATPTVLLGPVGARDGTEYWKPPFEPVRFVPREHIVGRALLIFWPFWPFGPQRVGFIR